MFFSLIIPVYNRPEEIRVVLEGLSQQTYKHFEVIVVEDGSVNKSDKIVEGFKDQLEIHYHYIGNIGQGFARNYGFEHSKGDYIIILDSDIIIPEFYLQNIYRHLQKEPLDCFGGPDKAHPAFSPLQKAIDYALTSYLTTGGIRGNAHSVSKFYPRSFNMGIRREVYAQTGGFNMPDWGEDLEFSMRIERAGFKIGLIKDAFVYHIRRPSLKAFFIQMVRIGKSRVNIARLFPGSTQAVHLIPLLAYLYLLLGIISLFTNPALARAMIAVVLLYLLGVILESFFRHRSLAVSLICLITAPSVFLGYGWGLMRYTFKQKGVYIRGKNA
jgi:glycosyltransferase involved in cell wall biosynthesis